MTLGGAAQVATAHRLNQRIWTPQFAARQTHLCPSQPHYSLHPAMFSGNDSLFLVALFIPDTNCFSISWNVCWWRLSCQVKVVWVWVIRHQAALWTWVYLWQWNYCRTWWHSGSMHSTHTWLDSWPSLVTSRQPWDLVNSLRWSTMLTSYIQHRHWLCCHCYRLLSGFKCSLKSYFYKLSFVT